jgi:hypothetical protein
MKDFSSVRFSTLKFILLLMGKYSLHGEDLRRIGVDQLMDHPSLCQVVGKTVTINDKDPTSFRHAVRMASCWITI